MLPWRYPIRREEVAANRIQRGTVAPDLLIRSLPMASRRPGDRGPTCVVPLSHIFFKNDPTPFSLSQLLVELQLVV